MKIKDIKKQFKSKFGLEIYNYNDVNKDKTIRRYKITYIGDKSYDIDSNQIDKNITEYFNYFKNELGLSNVTLGTGNGWFASNSIIIKVDNK
jgi:hypothetical protein